MQFEFFHNNVPQDTAKNVAEALKQSQPFGLRSPNGKTKYYLPNELKSVCGNQSFVFANHMAMVNDISFTLYRFKEFIHARLKIKSEYGANKNLKQDSIRILFHPCKD